MMRYCFKQRVRAQAFLRALGIEVTFSREGRAGNRVIKISTAAEKPHCSTVDNQRSDGRGFATSRAGTA
jgi:hypothetical protein